MAAPLLTFDQLFRKAVLTIHAIENYAGIRYVIHDVVSKSDIDFSGVDMIKIVAHALGARFTNTKVRPAVVSTSPTMREMTRALSELTQLDVGFFSNTQVPCTGPKKRAEQGNTR
jgi:hypothetical protein